MQYQRQNERKQEEDDMNRRELLKRSAALGFTAAIPSLAAGKLFAGAGTDKAQSSADKG